VIIRLQLVALALLTSACTSAQESELPDSRGFIPAPSQINEQERTPENTAQPTEHFTVSGNTLYGGTFTPADTPVSEHHAARHRIVVSFSEKTLRYFRRNGSTWKGVLGYAVITPKPHELPRETVVGHLRAIDKTPQWCPTENIRRVMPNLPPGCLPYKHPDNPMGTAKFIIDWPVPGWQYVRLHGHESYPSDWQSVETFGCVRLLDPAMQQLLTQLGSSAVSEGTVVIFRH
jgi:hypothetical protein